MLILGLVFLFNIAFVGINSGLDVPYAFLVEGCYQDTREPRFKDDLFTSTHSLLELFQSVLTVSDGTTSLR